MLESWEYTHTNVAPFLWRKRGLFLNPFKVREKILTLKYKTKPSS